MLEVDETMTDGSSARPLRPLVIRRVASQAGTAAADAIASSSWMSRHLDKEDGRDQGEFLVWVHERSHPTGSSGC